MRVRLRPGATVDEAIRLLEQMAINVYGQAMPPGAVDPSSKRDDYVRWATGAEQQLAGILDRKDALQIFENPRHRDIYSMAPGAQLTMLISAEVGAKSVELSQLAADLKVARDRVRQAAGYPAVVDTNVLLEYQRPDSVRWASVVGESANLILPLRVLEELDAKKYGDSPRLQRVARELLPWLEGLFSGSESGPVPLGDPDGSTIQILLTERPRYRPSDADEEVLDVASEIRSLASRVKLITADNALRLRARAAGLEVCEMPAKYARTAPPPA